MTSGVLAQAALQVVHVDSACLHGEMVGDRAVGRGAAVGR
eukprot:CAMPEP_0175103374 /NCGR_PEP_ID=MMETSP0086_2-20121207/9050_1 /TAXON_ID=136419 /ORGANISM="Unknown Unknown, Strain D1" /LENGTH=39 /DNA_ID= /DNA_START= /DNA_END= /DNA_ORIENTATION=